MDGKVVLITGGARGQGRAHAIRLAEEGADILVIDCPDAGVVPYELGTPDDLAETVREVEARDRRIIAVQGDVRRQEDLDGLVRQGIVEFGHIDVAVANAGIWTVGNFWELPEDEWLDVINVNLLGAMRALKAVAPHMIERGTGSMIIVASVDGVEAGVPFAHYVASKHAALGLMKAVALELGPRGIRCNAVLPGAVRTKMLDWPDAWDVLAGGPGLGTPEILDSFGDGFTLLKGVGLMPPSATSEGVLWLASDDSRYVTGLQLVIDGGHLIVPGGGVNVSVLEKAEAL